MTKHIREFLSEITEKEFKDNFTGIVNAIFVYEKIRPGAWIDFDRSKKTVLDRIQNK